MIVGDLIKVEHLNKWCMAGKNYGNSCFPPFNSSKKYYQENAFIGVKRQIVEIERGEDINIFRISKTSDGVFLRLDGFEEFVKNLGKCSLNNLQI